MFGIMVRDLKELKEEVIGGIKKRDFSNRKAERFSLIIRMEQWRYRKE